MLRTSTLIQEESRIFDEVLSRFGTLNEEQTQVVGVTREWSAKDLLGIWRIGSRAPRSRYWNSRPARGLQGRGPWKRLSRSIGRCGRKPCDAGSAIARAIQPRADRNRIGSARRSGGNG